MPITTFMTSPGRTRILHLEYLLRYNAQHAMIDVLLAAAALYGVAMLLARMRTMLALLARARRWRTALVYSYVMPFGYPKMNGTDVRADPAVGSRAGCCGSRADAVVIPALAIGADYLLRRFGARRALRSAMVAGERLARVRDGRSACRATTLSAPGGEAKSTSSSQISPCGFSKQSEIRCSPVPGPLHGRVRRGDPR